MVELSTTDETILEHCFTVELSTDELPVIDELSVIEEELSIVELSTEKELLDGQMSVETTAESSLTDVDVSASLDVLVSPVESSDDDPPPPPPLPHETKRSPKINNVIKKRKFFIFLDILNVLSGIILVNPFVFSICLNQIYYLLIVNPVLVSY